MVVGGGELGRIDQSVIEMQWHADAINTSSIGLLALFCTMPEVLT